MLNMNLLTTMNQEVSTETAINIVALIIQCLLILSMAIVLTGSGLGEPVDADNTPYQEYVSSISD